MRIFIRASAWKTFPDAVGAPILPRMITDLPNVLTLSRIAAIPVLIVLASLAAPAGDLAACIVFAAAGLTDFLDGRLARSRMLDPIADKLLVGAVLIMLAGDGRLGPWGLYPAIIIMLREILVSGLREFLAEIRVGLPVTRLAKWKTTAQMGALGFLIAGDPTARLLHMPWLPAWLIGTILLWFSAILTIVTGWDYLVAGLRHAESSTRQRHEAKPGGPASKISLS
jgi:cardiolipin synthase